jgi:KaiC/GvpD/RAD55 family RecA-like ATPase
MNRVRTGIPVLDDALRGGIPETAAVLLTGGPGTGKTTIAMEFLQQGIQNDEQCVFVSTEQAVDDLRAAFDGYDYTLDDPRLTLTTLHGSRDVSAGTDDSELVVRTLEGETPFADEESVPFTQESLHQYFDRFRPVDRIVLDSASGLASLTSDHAQYRQIMLDLIHQFKQQLSATTLLTAQDYATQDKTGTNHGTLASSHALEFTVDGVIHLWYDTWEGEYHRLLHITKMRGTDHDQRSFALSLEESGVHVKPFNRAPTSAFTNRDYVSTGMPKLDELLGGGVVSGNSMSYLYDGDTHAVPLLTKLIVSFLDRDNEVVMLPPPNLTYESLNHYAELLGDVSVDKYLASSLLRVLVVGGSVYSFLPSEMSPDGVESVKQRDIIQRLGQLTHTPDGRVVLVISCQALSLFMHDEVVREVIQQVASECRGSKNMAVFTAVPTLINEELMSSMMNASEQILSHKRQENGIESIRLDKGIGGEVGSSRLVEYYDEEPYLSLS